MMATIILQITNNVLKLTPIIKKGKQNQYGIPSNFLLPMLLQGGEAYKDFRNLAKFTRFCIEKLGFKNCEIIFCLADSEYNYKQFQHLPVNKNNLLSLAKLEAESVLQDDVNSYIIENYEYNKPTSNTDKLKSILYAVPNSVIKEIMTQFYKFKLKIVKVVPYINGLTCAGKSVVNYAPNSFFEDNKTIALVDIGREKISLSLFHSKCPIFERSFDSVYEEIVELLCRIKGITYQEADQILLNKGIYSYFNEEDETTHRQVHLLGETTCGEIIRNIRVVLSAERLELDHIIFSGKLASMPNFNNYIDQLSLDIPYSTMEQEFSLKQQIFLPQQTIDAGYCASDFFVLSGLVNKTYPCVNFLSNSKNYKDNHVQMITGMASVTFFMILVMLLQPILYWQAKNQNIADKSTLADSKYEEVKSLISQQAEFETTIAAMNSDKAYLPYGKSIASQILSQLNSKISPNVQAIASCSIDNLTGNINLNFITVDFASYVSLRNRMEQDDFFEIVIPFSVTTVDNGKACNCSTVLRVKNFEPYQANTNPSNSSSAESKDGDKK